MKKSLLALFLACTCILNAGAKKFKIASVDYELQSTKQYPLELAVEISKTRVFNSFEEFNDYIADVQQQLENQRVFSSAQVMTRFIEEGSDEELQLVHINVCAIDSKHFIAIPYPKYDSNSGVSAKLKVKDANFLGTMQPLSFDASYLSDMDEDTEDEQEKGIVFNFSYDYPFKLFVLDSQWNNDYMLAYTFGESRPEFAFKTGFTFKLPFETFALQLKVSQAITRDFDYTEYDDELYNTSQAELSMPVKIMTINKWGHVFWTPFALTTVNYDKNGINPENPDLTSPVLEVGHRLSTERINWQGSFRNGLSATVSQSVAYDYQLDEYSLKLSADLAAYKAFKYAGIASRFCGFAFFNDTAKIGHYLRGIRDSQKIEGSKKKALKVSGAMIFNFDVPIHIFTTNWSYISGAIFGEDSWITRHVGLFDFEMQVSPFFDTALTTNTVTKKQFAIKDGWYAGGLEVLIYPQKWRSLVVRASAGLDLGKKLIKKKCPEYYDDSWRRKDISEYEIYIGIGLHY